MKRVLSLFLSCIFVLGVCFSTPIIASAAELTFESGGSVFQYEESSTECSVEKWNGSDVALTLTNVQDENKITYTITGILSGAFSGCTALETLTIKSNIKTIEAGAFAGCTALTEFIEDIDSPNSNFEVVDGVLFNEAGTKLIAYPAAKTGTEYTIPEGVKEIATGAFADVSETFILEASDPTKITANPDGLVIHNVLAEDEQHTVNYGVSENAIKAKCFCGIDLETIAMIGYAGAFTDTNDKKWAKSATINAASEYTLSLDVEGVYNEDLSIETMNNSELSFWAKKGEGAAQKVTIDLGLELDSIAPTGTITLDENNIWTSLAETITFGLFFKDAETVTIEANDAGSGVKSVEYCVSKEEIENIESANVVWKAYDSSIALSLLSKNIVYVRITDNVGNVRYISSNGIVLYSDSEADTESLEITYKSNENKDVTVKLNGNTINSVICDKGEFGVSNYTVDSDKIILKGEYLEKLSYGEYTYTVSYNPLGVDFVSGTNNSVPATTEFKVIVNKADITGATLPEAKTGLVYDGSEQSLVSAGSIEEGTVQYRLSENEDWSNTVPTGDNAGDYTVYYKISLDENYNDITGSIPVTIAEAASSVATAPTANELTYTGSAQALVTAGEATNGTMQYKLGETGDWNTEIPTGTDAGTYKVYYKVVGDPNYSDAEEVLVNVTITKATPTVTAPTAITGLVYNGGEQELVNAGTANSGVLEYSLDNETWSEDIPEGLEAGEYTVYYRVGITDNYNGVDGNVNVTIAPKTIDVSLIKESYKYDGSHHILTFKFTNADDENDVTLNGGYEVKTYKNDTLVNLLIDVGEYKVVVTLEENSNYTFINAEGQQVREKELTYTITKGVASITTAPTVNGNLVYSGVAKVLVTAGSANGGIIYYTLTPNVESSWSSTIPTGIAAGTYYVYYKVVGDTNHSDSEVASVEVTIQPKSVANATITLKEENFIYNGSAIEPTVTVNDYNAEDYDVAYENNINAGTATVKVTFKGNYEGEATETFEIDKKVVTITAKDVTLVKNAEMPEFTEYTEDGLIDGHTVAVTLTPEVDNTATVGEFSIIASAAIIKNGEIDVTKNYDIEYINGLLNVTECTEHDWIGGVCAICKTVCEHKFDSPEITKNPTCNAPGELTWVCTICKHSKVTTVNPDGDGKNHDWSGDYVLTKAATCVSEGVETKTCKNGCGEETTRKIAIDAEAHVMGEWITTEQTCVTDGKKVRTCTLGCGATETEVIKADNKSHKLPDEWTVTKGANCVEDGEKIKACLNEGCTYVAKESIPADGKSHNLGEWEVTIPAKCTVKGEVTQYCQNGDCTHKVTASLKPDGKNHDFAEEFTVIESTCVAKGSKFKVCENEGCKEVTEKTEIAINPDAHKNIVTINAKEATCEEKGYTGDEFCNDCKKTTDPGIEINAKGHTESDWIVDKEPTFTEEGAKHTACTVCKKELKKEVIAKRALEVPEVKIENASNGIKVSWSQDEDATGYTVYSSTYNASTKKWSSWKNRGTAAATKSSWTDKTVTEGVTYRYTVRSVNGTNKSNYKATGGLCYVVAPKVTVSITSTGLLAKWNKVNNATSYIVYRRALVNGVWSSWVNLGSTKAEKNTWSDTSVQSGVTYRYTVRAVVGKVKSGYTASSSIICLAQPLLKISNANTGITGKWDPIAGATGYTIYRSEYNPSTKKWSKWLTLGTTGATAKTFTDKTVKSGYEYKYTIRAVSGKFKSTYQDSNKLVYLAQPTLKISNVANGIQGKWSQVNGATGYIIYRRELKDGKWSNWTSLGTTKSTAKSFTDKTVKSGVTYSYTIRAKNGSYKSSYVSTGSLVFLSVPTVKISNGITGVNVSWSKIEGATSYLVYRREVVNGKWSGWTQLKTVTETSLVDETVKSGTNYRYTVRALNGKSSSMYTSTGTLYYLTAPTVTVEKVDGVVKVNWTQTVGAKGYTIYRAELGADGKWSKWVTLGTATEKYSSCKDKTAKTGVTYKYTVRAVNGKVKSAYVDGAQITNQ